MVPEKNITIHHNAQPNRQQMSLEPQTTAKVRLDTTKGPLTIELWAKETPSNSRLFLQNTLNQRFNGLSFDRVVPNFIVQLNGDLPTEEPQRDEPHSRLKYSKRGIVGCVNSGTGRDSNDGRFFITLKETPELQGRNTIIGKVVDDTIFNVLAIAEGKLGDDGETPLYPVKVTSSEVLVPFFNDLVQREEVIVDSKVNEKRKKNKRAKVKLSLGAEEEDGDDDQSVANIKMKSAHDVLNDKKLSKQKVDVKKLIEAEPEPEPEAEAEGKEKEEATLEEKKQPVQAIAKDRESSLSDIKNRIDSLKSELQAKHETEEQPQTSIKIKQSNEDREKETLKLLEWFKTNLSKFKPTKELETITKDIDFDKLSESDSDTDIYNHQLNFEENEDNKLANEELLIIDSKNEKTQTKRLNRFYEKESVKRTRKQ